MKVQSIIVGALLSVAATAVHAAGGADVYQQVRPSLVQLVGTGDGGRMFMGTGVALPNGKIATNCHVTQHARRVQPFWGNGNLNAELQHADVLHDLCLLHIPGVQARAAEMGSSRALKIGAKVYAVGFNGGRRLTYEAGEVTELYNFDGGMVIRTTAAFSQGASGGGLFDEDGRLVGILTFFRVSGEVAYFAVPIEWLQAVEQQAARPVGPMEGVPFWADALERQPAFLQAGALEADGRWQELMSLARTWTESAPHDGQAWYALAKAAVRTGDQATARSAMKAATEYGIPVGPSREVIPTDR